MGPFTSSVKLTQHPTIRTSYQQLKTMRQWSKAHMQVHLWMAQKKWKIWSSLVKVLTLISLRCCGKILKKEFMLENHPVWLTSNNSAKNSGVKFPISQNFNCSYFHQGWLKQLLGLEKSFKNCIGSLCLLRLYLSYIKISWMIKWQIRKKIKKNGTGANISLYGKVFKGVKQPLVILPHLQLSMSFGVKWEAWTLCLLSSSRG